MKRRLFLITFFCFSTALCHAQFSDDAKYEQANKYHQVKDYKRAFPLFLELAEKGDAAAQRVVGIYYDFGYLAEGKDNKQAFKWYQKAAENGDVVAMVNLGNCYRDGEIVEQSLDKAYEYYIKAVKSNEKYIYAKILLGDLYFYDDYQGPDKDNSNHAYDYSAKQAEKWYRLAAKSGDSRAMYKLGCFYEFYANSGIGGDFHQDYEMLFRKSAEAGYGDAQASMAMTELELREKPNYNLALDWVRKAQKNGAKSVLSRTEDKNISLTDVEILCLFQLKNSNYHYCSFPKNISNTKTYCLIVTQNGYKGVLRIKNNGDIISTIIPIKYSCLEYEITDDENKIPYEKYKFSVVDKDGKAYIMDVNGKIVN